MNPVKKCVLIINGGSSSIKFAVYSIETTPTLVLHGMADAVNTNAAIFSFRDAVTGASEKIPFHTSVNISPAENLLKRLEKLSFFPQVMAIGHRIVQGWNHTEPEIITAELLQELKTIIPYDPEHLPGEIDLIEIFAKYYPALVQVACFDTSFHASMPAVAKLLPIPRRFAAKGIKRYGFHGLSYAWLMEELYRVAGKEAAGGKIIIAHLGNGSSLAAIKDGKSIDTTMGFTPASGVVMGTRSGDIDPGIAWYLMAEEKLNPEQFNHLVNHLSGMLGISETSADMRQLLAIEKTDYRAAEAIELFCYQVKKHIGALAAVLGGVNTLIFSGGIGEHSQEIRKRICSTLGFLGIELDEGLNENNKSVISLPSAKVTTRVINTNEELMIAKYVLAVLNTGL